MLLDISKNELDAFLKQTTSTYNRFGDWDGEIIKPG